MWLIGIAGAAVLGLLATLAVKQRRNEFAVLPAMGEKGSKLVAQQVLEICVVAVLALTLSALFAPALTRKAADTLLSSEAKEAHATLGRQPHLPGPTTPHDRSQTGRPGLRTGHLLHHPRTFGQRQDHTAQPGQRPGQPHPGRRPPRRTEPVGHRPGPLPQQARRHGLLPTASSKSSANWRTTRTNTSSWSPTARPSPPAPTGSSLCAKERSSRRRPHEMTPGAYGSG